MTAGRGRHRHSVGAPTVVVGGLPDPVDETPGPLAYSGPDAVACPVCGVGLEPENRSGQPPIRRHARFGWAPSPARGRPLCRGVLLSEELKARPGDRHGMDQWSEEQARKRRLVTRGMIARRYGLGVQELGRLIKAQPGFPRAVAKLEGSHATYLYEAEPVARFMELLLEGEEVKRR